MWPNDTSRPVTSRHDPNLILTTACIPFFAHGQATQHDCTAHTITEHYLAQQGLSTDLQAALPHVNGSFRGGSYTVPVVVHVVYNTTAENVSDAAIMAMVNQMNQDYSETNSDIGIVRPAFSGVVANVGFNFCLAQIDPSGNATTGITRTQTSQTWFDPDTETEYHERSPVRENAVEHEPIPQHLGL
ncbi:MAG: hypothetical protein IPO10_18485 [Flavobacteriales bacterium]|nr:hypothetical protein [Flavobacteriales bacterium]